MSVIAGALRSPDSDKDWVYERVAAAPNGTYRAEFPPEFDLRPKVGPVRDQGARSSCVAFSATVLPRQGEVQSPEFVYSQRINKPGKGMYAKDALRILHMIGSVAEKLLPYQSDESAVIGPELVKAAGQNKIKHYAKITTVDGLKRALLEEGPCMMVLPCYNNGSTFWIPERGGPVAPGGHAVAVVGYTRAGFILRNSWGAEWGEDGCVVFPYSDFDSVWEAWVASAQ